MNRKTIIAALAAAADECNATKDYSTSDHLTNLARRIAMSQEGDDKTRVLTCMVNYANEIEDRGDIDMANNLTTVVSRVAQMAFDASAPPTPPREMDLTSDEAREHLMGATTAIRDHALDHLSIHHKTMLPHERAALEALLHVTDGHDAEADAYLEHRLRPGQ